MSSFPIRSQEQIRGRVRVGPQDDVMVRIRLKSGSVPFDPLSTGFVSAQVSGGHHVSRAHHPIRRAHRPVKIFSYRAAP